MKIAAKPYKTRGMVEVDQTRTNFDAIFHCGSIALQRSMLTLSWIRPKKG